MDEQNPQAQTEQAFSDALAAFSKDDAPAATVVAQAPTPVVEGDEPETPKPEGEQLEGETTVEPEAAKPVEEAPEKPPEFVKFDKPEQLKRFNDVFGYAKRLERQLEELRRQPPAPPPQPVAPPAPVFQPQTFAEPEPKLADYETADQWGLAVAAWARKAAVSEAVNTLRHETAQQQTQREQREQEAQVSNYINQRIGEGRSKFGMEFDAVSVDLAPFAPYGSNMHQTLFSLQNFPDVVMELGRNLVEADRIARLSPHDQIYEIKDLAKKLIAKQALAAKAQTKLPTKVEAPGQGEDLKTKPSTTKLRMAAKASGELKDWAKVFMSDPTM